MVKTIKTYPCGSEEEMEINAQNSDANCHRKRTNYSKRLVAKNSSICDTCVYNEGFNFEYYEEENEQK